MYFNLTAVTNFANYLSSVSEAVCKVFNKPGALDDGNLVKDFWNTSDPRPNNLPNYETKKANSRLRVV